MEKEAENLLKKISNNENISMKMVIKKLDRCMKEVSFNLNKTLSEVYKEFYGFLNPNYGKICKQLDPNSCKECDYCTLYENECVPVVLKDYIEIEKDPDMYVSDKSINDLKKIRALASHLYYNVGSSGISDNSYDAIVYHLRKKLSKINKKIEKIGAIPIKKLRTDLPYPMASLDKVHVSDKAYALFLEKVGENGLIWSDKLDGVSALVIYKKGKAISLYTRGNGLIGGDISYLLEYLELPEIENNENIAIRGELLVKKEVFSQKYKDMYANSRSFVVSQVNKGFITPSVIDIDFIAYEIVDGVKDKTTIQQLSFLSMNDFKTVSHSIFPKTVKLMDITLTYKERRENSIYDIDGLVLEYNSVNSRPVTLENPKYKVAFKMTFTSQVRSSVVTGIDWDISRYGKYIPVAEFKPVYIDHIRIRRATAHNAAHVRDWNMGKGTKIKVVRAGDVIPQIKDVEIDVNGEPEYPDYGYDWGWQNRNIVLDDIENNPRVLQKRILHFLQVIEVPGIGIKTVEKLYGAGLKNIKKVYNTSIKELVKIKGIGNKKAVNFKYNIVLALSKTPLDRFLSAITITNFSLSRKLLREIFRTFPYILEKPFTENEILSILKSKKIKGIGPKRLKMISTELPKFRKILFELDPIGIKSAIKKSIEYTEQLKMRGYNPKIKNKRFVLSGFMKPDYKLEELIFNHMGETIGSVTSNTEAVIVFTNGIITPKILKAREFNIPIFTKKEFLDFVSD